MDVINRQEILEDLNERICKAKERFAFAVDFDECVSTEEELNKLQFTKDYISKFAIIQV